MEKNNIQVTTSNSHNENQSLLRISKLALFRWYSHLGAPGCDVSFKNSALGKAVGNTNTAMTSLAQIKNRKEMNRVIRNL